MIGKYLKETAAAIACFCLTVLVVDSVLAISAPISESAGDILYLNLLMFAAAVSFWIFGYIRFRRRMLPIEKLLKGKAPAGSSYSLIKAAIERDGDNLSRVLDRLADYLYEDFSETVRQYQKNMDELNDYITQWAHEIKIPLSVLELLLEKYPGKAGDSPRKIKIELERMKFLVNQILYAGRAAKYEADFRVSEISLEKIVKEAVRRNSTPFIMKDIEVVTGDLGFAITQDEKWISYILDQILNNAAKYTGKGGRVEIRAEEDEKNIRLCIQDNGMGIPPHDIDRIFEKGFTGENGRLAGKSTGMGLYYSKKMAERLDIGLEAYSEQNVYTRFELIFMKPFNWQPGSNDTSG